MFRAFIVASALILAVTVNVQAQPAVSTATVALGDLNLSDPADAARLDARIHAAAVTVCGPTDYPLGIGYTQFLAARQRTEDCVRLTERRTHAHLATILSQAAPAVRMAAAGP
jgi:UrcA family protein